MATLQPNISPEQFIAKWRRNAGGEMAGGQEWFIDVCRMVGHGTPNEIDPRQEWYTFERTLRQNTGRPGRADVFKRGYFAWEFKGAHSDLDAAYRQLQRYREALNNPPLLVVSDFRTIRVHTNFTNKVPVVHTIGLDDLHEPEALEILRNIFHNPDALEPEVSPNEVTEETAGIFAAIAQLMRERDVDSLEVARFLNRLVFCFFAQDVGLLPNRVLSQLCENYHGDPAEFDDGLRDLFAQMNEGGRFGVDRIRQFNGDLFSEPGTILMTTGELEKLAEAPKRNWAHIEPSIFGTLFERAVDPNKQGLVGAQYTSEEDILAVIKPVIINPLLAEWHDVESKVGGLVLLDGHRDEKQARELLLDFQGRLSSLRVLDPACGSGNFLYVALRHLHDLEKAVLTLAAEFGLRNFMPEVSPEQFYGIEIDPYASDLARTALWIGHLQWLIENGHQYNREPVLGSLNTIECRDAIVDIVDPERSAESHWPSVDYIVGNPPFLGHVPFRERLGDDYADRLYSIYGDQIPNSSDLCCYWFEKARAEIADGKARRAGLLATQAIRTQSNRPVLERIKDTGDIFEAVSDKDWVLDGANVHISIICFDDGSETNRTLDGERVNNINPDLTGGADLTRARPLSENLNLSFQGVGKVGDFDISEDLALEMMEKPNPHGRPNSDVIRPWINGIDIARRPRRVWIIDFGVEMSEEDAALYEAPFEYVKGKVMPARINNRNQWRAENWWLHGSPATSMRQALSTLPRYIGTPKVAKHRFFVWLQAETLPSNLVIAIARDDDYTFGVLSSSMHQLWTRRVGSQLRESDSGGTYTPTTCFEEFPFPEPNDNQREAIASAARELNELRENWRNPFNLLGEPALNADQLRRRTLTNLYNDNPSWLAHAHAKLDQAVADAYGWPADLADGEVLERLLELNLSRPQPEEAEGDTAD